MARIFAVLFIFTILGLFYAQVYGDHKSGRYPKLFTVFFMIVIVILAAIGAGWIVDHYILSR